MHDSIFLLLQTNSLCIHCELLLPLHESMSIEDRGCISDYIDSGYRCLAVRFCLDGKKRIISFDSRIEGLSLVSRETANVQTVKFVYCTRRIFWIRSFEVRLFSSIDVTIL